jgi:phospholipid-binding lipoprotein MlaA
MRILVHFVALVALLLLLPGTQAAAAPMESASAPILLAQQQGPASEAAREPGRAPAEPAAADASAAQGTAGAEPAATGAEPGAADGGDLSGFESEIASELDKEFAETQGQEVWDPLSGYNRFMTGFNDTLYVWVLDPTARGYRFVVPGIARRGVANFFDNLLFPVRFVNNLFQLKLRNTGTETLRFVTNTTVGVGGLWDPARLWFRLQPRPEDFGQTLGYYGVGPGFHVVLPVLGPSNLRDAVGILPDYYLEPVAYVDPWEPEYAIRAFDRVNYTSLHLGEYENLKKDAIDFYPFLRDLYEQNRIRKIEE